MTTRSSLSPPEARRPRSRWSGSAGRRADAALRALAGRLPEPRRASAGHACACGAAKCSTGPWSCASRARPARPARMSPSFTSTAAGRWLRRCWRALAGSTGCGAAEPGEFTRRAFENGRIDLAEAEGLADLLSAETQSQRRAALAMAGGALSRRVGGMARAAAGAGGAGRGGARFLRRGRGRARAFRTAGAHRPTLCAAEIERRARPASVEERCGKASEWSSRARRTRESPAFSTY